MIGAQTMDVCEYHWSRQSQNSNESIVGVLKAEIFIIELRIILSKHVDCVTRPERPRKSTRC